MPPPLRAGPPPDLWVCGPSGDASAALVLLDGSGGGGGGGETSSGHWLARDTEGGGGDGGGGGDNGGGAAPEGRSWPAGWRARTARAGRGSSPRRVGGAGPAGAGTERPAADPP